MDNHTQQNENEYVAVVPNNVGHLLQAPTAAHLVHHVLGGVPSRFVGLGRVEVGAATEEQTCKGDESKGLENGPSVLQPLPGFLAAQEIVNHANHISCQHNQTPNKQHIEHGLRHIDAQHAQGEGDRQNKQSAPINAPVAPEFVENHAEAVQAAPDHEIP